MRVSVVRGGGLSGLVTQTAVASDSLKPEDAAELERKVEQAGVLDLPAEGAASRQSHPDEMSYSLTVEHEGRDRTVTLPEGDLPAPVRALIDWVGSHPNRDEWTGSPVEFAQRG